MRISVLFIIAAALIWDACIDRLTFDVGERDEGVLVVDGLITDEEGPYSVRLLRSSNVDDVLNFSQPIVAKKVEIFNDNGISEILAQTELGVYQTKRDGIRGKIGEKYHLRIELNSGQVYESIPEELKPVGKIDSLYWEYESFLPISGPTQYGFRIFVDSKNLSGNNDYVRWKFRGTYRVETNPELHEICPCNPNGYPAPRECSGVVYHQGLYLRRIGPCACCVCWVNQFEDKPVVRNNDLVTEGNFKHIEMGYVPINEWTFFSNKYLVEVEQLSMTQSSYEFWKVIKDQKEGVASLFQPSFGRAPTNIVNVNGSAKALGQFNASAVSKKLLWITAKDVPFSIPVPLLKIKESCLNAFSNSSTKPPPDWQ